MYRLLDPHFSSAPPTSTVFSKIPPYRNIHISYTHELAHGHHFLKERPMHNQMGKIGNIRRILEGKACPFCHGHQYQLVLRGDMALQAGGLFARCSQCQRPRGLGEDIGRILWM